MSSGGVLHGRYRDGLHIGIGSDPHHDVQVPVCPGVDRRHGQVKEAPIPVNAVFMLVYSLNESGHHAFHSSGVLTHGKTILFYRS